jgi:plastocyanin
MHRTLLCIAGALVLAVPLAACGGGDDTASTTSTTSAAGGAHPSLTVHAEDQLKFDKTAYTTEAGTVDVTYVNDGTVSHTLLIKDVKGFKLTIGGTDEGSVDLTAGTYTLYCDLPGHEAAGMKASLTVS